MVSSDYDIMGISQKRFAESSSLSTGWYIGEVTFGASSDPCFPSWDNLGAVSIQKHLKQVKNNHKKSKGISL